jgi:hypothetical protein
VLAAGTVGTVVATRVLYPMIEPYASGMLDVGDGTVICWETCGNPNGTPALADRGRARRRECGGHLTPRRIALSFSVSGAADAARRTPVTPRWI